MRAFWSGVRTQYWLVRRQPDDLLTLCTIPFTAVIMLSVVIHATRPDLVANALLAPALIGLWAFAINVAGDAMESERWAGTIDLGIAAPGSLHSVYFGRVMAVMGLGVIPLGETWLLGWAFFDVAPEIHHPWMFTATMVASVFAMGGTGMAYAAAMLMSRNSGVYGNFLSFPIYILSGVMVPVSYLPDFLEPLSRLVFLSWSADLMRDSLAVAPVADPAPRLGAIVVLGVVGLVGGRFMLAKVLRRARELGTVTHG